MYLRTLWVPPPIMMEVLAAANDSDYLVVPLAIRKIWPQLSPDKGMKDLDFNEGEGSHLKEPIRLDILAYLDRRPSKIFKTHPTQIFSKRLQCNNNLSLMN